MMKTILIVDDIKVNLKVLEVLLTRNGYAVLSSMSAEKALFLLQERSCDLIISDIQMPEMDGIQFCRLCQLDEKLRHIPFIFYSSIQNIDQTRQLAQKVGARNVIRKPADPARLLKTISTVLAEQSCRFSLQRRRQESPPDPLPWAPVPPGREMFFDRLLENVPGIVWSLDENGDFTYISPSVERLTGFTVSRIRKMGKSGWLNRIHSADEKKIRMAYKQLFQENSPLDIVYRFECLDNRLVWFHEKSGLPYANEAKGCFRVDGLTTDISPRIQAKDRRIRIMEQDVVSIFSKGISHDLDNLLNGIVDYIQLSAMTSENLEARDRFLANALKISRSALDLNQDILLLSNKDKSVEKNSLLTRVAARTVQSLLKGSDIQYRVDMPDELWPCRVDPQLMARALEYVIINACEAVSQRKDGMIVLAFQNLSIESIEKDPDDNRSKFETDLGPGRYVRVVIQDNGCGIYDKSLHRIFYPYYSTKPRDMKKGVGLSLGLTRVIVLQHRGEMVVHSRKNHGTKVTIFLPANTEDTWNEDRSDRG
jgi:PAS domain S-box-containing protein